METQTNFYQNWPSLLRVIKKVVFIPYSIKTQLTEIHPCDRSNKWFETQLSLHLALTDLRYNNLKDTTVIDPHLWLVLGHNYLRSTPLRLICNTSTVFKIHLWDWFKKQKSWIHPCGCYTHCCTSSGTKMYSIGMIWPSSDRDRTNLSLEENLALEKKNNNQKW